MPLGAPSPGKDPEQRKKPSKSEPLVMRLYFQPLLTELTRAVGYQEWPLTALKSALHDLRKRYGEAVVQDAMDELLTREKHGKTQVLRLRDEVRKLARGMLGPTPEEQVNVVAYPTPTAITSQAVLPSTAKQSDAELAPGSRPQTSEESAPKPPKRRSR